MAMYRIRYFSGFGELPARYASLIAAGSTLGLFFDREWFALLMRETFDGRDAFRLYAVESAQNDAPLLLVPLRVTAFEPAVPGGRVIGSVSHQENYAPAAFVFAPSLGDPIPVLSSLFRHLKAEDSGNLDPPCDALRFWPLEVDSPSAAAILTALRRVGYRCQVFENSYNRYESTVGVSYSEYFAARSANHRYNIRRRQRALEKAGRLDLVLFRDRSRLEEAMADYFAVSLASWKSPTSMIAKSTLDLIDLAARKGCLRLGILRLDGVALAAQFWIVTGGVAYCSRLAYREDHKDLAPGVVLTNFMIAQLLDQDHVARIDFGYGEDEYKGGWMKSARNYYGILAFNPATRRGLYHGLKHILGRPVKRATKRLLGLVRPVPPRPPASDSPG